MSELRFPQTGEMLSLRGQKVFWNTGCYYRIGVNKRFYNDDNKNVKSDAKIILLQQEA
jgi:hypothetical protein